MASKLLFVRDLAPNMAVDTPFLVRKVERKMTKPNARSESKPYLALELADKTGVVAGRVWNDALPFVEDTMTPDTVVNIQGTTQDYAGEISLVITDATAMPEAALDDYVPTSPRDRAQMRREYTGLAGTVGNTELANLLQTFIQSADFEEFCKAPAAATEAYAYLGGLLEHTLGVAQMALAIATSRSDIDTDLLLTAALLHDLGKVDAFSLMSFAPGDDLQLLDAPALALVRLDRLVDAAGGVGDPGPPEAVSRRGHGRHARRFRPDAAANERSGDPAKCEPARSRACGRFRSDRRRRLDGNDPLAASSLLPGRRNACHNRRKSRSRDHPARDRRIDTAFLSGHASNHVRSVRADADYRQHLGRRAGR